LRDLGVGGRMILKWNLKEIKGEGVDWIHLALEKVALHFFII
jgi:hypothetical protein